jgi:2-keto-4-pentenoate hydratase
VKHLIYRACIYRACLLLCPVIAGAHHSTVANFTREVISVDGVIEQVRFQNPHASVLIRHADESGNDVYWLVETAAKTTLQRKGITLDVLAVGSKVTATGLKGRRAHTMYLQQIAFEDGQVFAPDAESVTIRDATIREEIQKMADDWVNFRMMQGFHHQMPLDEAYRWQDQMIEILRPTLGGVVGYKTGGHNVGPSFPTFPADGIRAYILSGMLREDGTAIRLEDTKVGFLEADIAFRVGNVSINTAETDLEILAGLDAMVPFAEVPDPYYDPDTRTVNGTIVANMSTRMSFTGEPVPIEATPEWLEKLNTLEFAVLDEHDNVIQSGSLEGWYEPITVVRWLRDQLKESGKELIPGQLLSLGNIGIIRQIHEGSPRGPAYTSNQFRLEYYGIREDGPATVTINIDR